DSLTVARRIVRFFEREENVFENRQVFSSLGDELIRASFHRWPGLSRRRLTNAISLGEPGHSQHGIDLDGNAHQLDRRTAEPGQVRGGGCQECQSLDIQIAGCAEIETDRWTQ